MGLKQSREDEKEKEYNEVDEKSNEKEKIDLEKHIPAPPITSTPIYFNPNLTNIPKNANPHDAMLWRDREYQILIFRWIFKILILIGVIVGLIALFSWIWDILLL